MLPVNLQLSNRSLETNKDELDFKDDELDSQQA